MRTFPSKVRFVGLSFGSVAIFISLLLLSVSTAAPPAVKSKPPAQWNPAALNAIVPRNGQTNVNVSLNALEALGNVTFEIVPELNPYIVLSPSGATDIHAGDTIPIRVTFRAGVDAPLRLFEGNIKVREETTRTGKGQVLPLPLPVYLIVRAAEDTIASSDTNTNGVWDYIDQYIENTYPGTENHQVRAGARQYARSIEGGLLNAENKTLSIQFAQSADRAMECIYSIRPQDARQLISQLEAAILNTPLRSRAFGMFSDQSAGQVFRATPFSERSASCFEE